MNPNVLFVPAKLFFRLHADWANTDIEVSLTVYLYHKYRARFNSDLTELSFDTIDDKLAFLMIWS